MINFKIPDQKPVWPNTFTQDGVYLSRDDVENSIIKSWSEYVESKRPDFEQALEKRCKEINEVYVKMGFHPQVGLEVYQVGLSILAIDITTNGPMPVQVGQIG